MVRIAQYRGISLVSRIIKLVCRGPYSHTAIMLADDCIVEAWEGSDSVRIIKSLSEGHTPGTVVDVFELPCTTAEEAVMSAFAMDQEGKDYDYLGLKGFYLNKMRKPNDDWFCSKLCAAMTMKADLRLWGRDIEPWQVSPTMITRTERPKFLLSTITS